MSYKANRKKKEKAAIKTLLKNPKFFYSYQLNDFVGKTLKIKLKDKMNDKKTFKAILKSVENDSLELNIGKEELTIDFGIIDMCKLMPNYKEILREKNGR